MNTQLIEIFHTHGTPSKRNHGCLILETNFDIFSMDRDDTISRLDWVNNGTQYNEPTDYELARIIEEFTAL